MFLLFSYFTAQYLLFVSVKNILPSSFTVILPVPIFPSISNFVPLSVIHSLLLHLKFIVPGVIFSNKLEE